MTTSIPAELKRARERAGLGIAELEQTTRIRAHVLETLEAGRFGELPSGLYARAVVRTYAAAVGLDGDALVRALGRQLPAVEDPLDGLARLRGLPVTTSAVAPPAAGDGQPIARFAAASAVDAALLAAIALGVLVASARLCGVGPSALFGFALPSMIALWSVIGSLYFLLFGGLGGETPGTRLAGLPPIAAGRPPLAGHAIARRAAAFALREASIVAELLFARRRITAAGTPGVSRSETQAAARATDR